MALLTKCVFQPMAEDEEPGMPSFEVEGIQESLLFKGVISIELDGRDIEWEGTPALEEMVQAYNMTTNSDLLNDICEEIYERHPGVWAAAKAAHGY